MQKTINGRIQRNKVCIFFCNADMALYLSCRVIDDILNVASFDYLYRKTNHGDALM